MVVVYKKGLPMKHIYFSMLVAGIMGNATACEQQRDLPAVIKPDAAEQQEVVFSNITVQDLDGYERKGRIAGGRALDSLYTLLQKNSWPINPLVLDEIINKDLALLCNVMSYTIPSSDFHQKAFQQVKNYFKALQSEIGDIEAYQSVLDLAGKVDLADEVKNILEFIDFFIEHVCLLPSNLSNLRLMTACFMSRFAKAVNIRMIITLEI